MEGSLFGVQKKTKELESNLKDISD